MKLTNAIVIMLSVALAHCSSHFNPLEKKDKNTKSYTSADDLDEDDGSPDERALDLNITNLPVITDQLGLTNLYQRSGRGQGLRIAIIDNGYAGLESSLGKRLPPGLEIEPAPKNAPKETVHGTRLAELVYSIATGSTQYHAENPGPTLILYNGNGWTNTEYAFRDAVKKRVHYILYSQVWEYGGNLDGTGFINEVVNEAIDSGAIVVNSAGNFGKTMYQAPVTALTNGYLKLPYQEKYLRLTITEPQTPVKISLGWNDFKDTITYRTPQNLDLELYSNDLTPIAGSTLIQDGKAHPDTERDYSAHAREVITTVLDPGTYLLAVKQVSNNFRPDSRFWISVNGYGSALPERGKSNSVLIPTDNPRVLSAGASDVDFTSRSYDGTDRYYTSPLITVPSNVNYSNGEFERGTSMAAAILQGALAVVHTVPNYALNRKKFKDLVRDRKLSDRDIPLSPNDTKVVPVFKANL